jgi:hypothetical protein
LNLKALLKSLLNFEDIPIELKALLKAAHLQRQRGEQRGERVVPHDEKSCES